MTTKATAENVYARYEQDFDLSDPPPLNLLPEYLEMVIQYGVVVLFGAAFPLAPLFALINNIIEIRIDASKLVVDQRRVVPHQGCDIGSWQSILEFLTRLGILTNALIIAFTTDLIDRVVYRLAFNENHDLHGYLNFILAEFNTTDWEDPKLAVSSDFGNVTTCRYRGYFTHPRADKPYTLARPGWMVLLAKFGFLLIFPGKYSFMFKEIATSHWLRRINLRKKNGRKQENWSQKDDEHAKYDTLINKNVETTNV